MVDDALDLAVALGAVLALAIILRDRANPRWWRPLAIAMVAIVVHDVVLRLPLHVPEARLLGGYWNWTGKLFAIAAGLGFAALVDPADSRRWLRLPAGDPVVYLGLGAVAVLAFVVSLLVMWPRPFDGETIAFQLTLPTIDEELFYRGVVLSLLSAATRSRVAPILITALLFGLAHIAVASFEPLVFIRTFAFGLVCGWLTVRSDRSLWPAAVFHSTTNTLPQLAGMLI
ncbi:MAG: CPBP family intramembrane glutamic endopeptidase [Kofleriaceae bacterium]